MDLSSNFMLTMQEHYWLTHLTILYYEDILYSWISCNVFYHSCVCQDVPPDKQQPGKKSSTWIRVWFLGVETSTCLFKYSKNSEHIQKIQPPVICWFCQENRCVWCATQSPSLPIPDSIWKGSWFVMTEILRTKPIIECPSYICLPRRKWYIPRQQWDKILW